MRAPAFLTLGLLLASAPLAAQGEPASLFVTVRVEGGGTMAGAQVVLEGLGLGGITDGSGVARLRNLAPGAKTVVVRHLGYAPARGFVSLEGGRAATVTFTLVPQPIELAAVTVRARGSSLVRNGFYDRQSGGGGTFITRQEIARLRPRYMSDVVRRLAGVRLHPTGVSGNTRISLRDARPPGGCPVQYYLDGAITSISNIDEIQPYDVEGIEIYRGAASVPPGFNVGTASCGVVLVWTRVE
jgi:hypothetical protein